MTETVKTQDSLRSFSFETLSQQDEWLRLGHYEKKLWGGYESKVRGKKFFLSEKGSVSPAAELEATFNAMFGSDAHLRQETQCAYLARRDFILKHYPSTTLETCEKFNEWIEKINPEKVSLIFATGMISSPASSFGHVFLKFHNSRRGEGLELLDYSVNYAARTADTRGALYAWYGLLGYFPGTYGMAPYHHLIKEYTNMEGRDLWEYELNFTRHENETLFKHLWELERGYFDYYFLDENCALLITRLLEVARPSMKLWQGHDIWVLPLDTVKSAYKAGIVSSAEFRPSLQSALSAELKPLSLSGELKIRELNQNRHNIEKQKEIINEMNVQELEAAQTYFNMKLMEDVKAYKDVLFYLGRRRASLNTLALAKTEVTAPPSPHLRPDSAMTALWGEGPLYGVSVRPAGYDLLSSHLGVAAFSEFEVLKFDLNFNSKESSDFVHDLKVLNVLNSTAINGIERPLSFGFAAQYSDRWQGPIKLGWSVDLGPHGRWMNFAKARWQEKKGPETSYKPVVGGLESLLAFEFQNRIRAFVSYESLENEKVQWKSGASIDLQKNIELRVSIYERSQFSLLAWF